MRHLDPKSMRRTIISLAAGIILLFLPSASFPQNDIRPGIGIVVKASTNGLGGDILYSFNNKLNLRAGGEVFKYDRDIGFSENDIDYEAVVEARVGSISLLLDYVPLSWFFISGGAGYNLFHGDVNGNAASGMPFGDIVIPEEKIGTFEFDLDPGWKVSPYLGIGFGTIYNREKRLGFAFELGSFYQGKPDIGIQTDGLLSPTSNPDQGQESRLERQIDQYYLYPVIKFSLSVRIAEFN